jgi:hypothetical protein
VNTREAFESWEAGHHFHDSFMKVKNKEYEEIEAEVRAHVMDQIGADPFPFSSGVA